MFGLYAAAVTFGVLAVKELYFIFGTGAHAFHFKPFLDFLIVAVTIVVVAIPEGVHRMSMAITREKAQFAGLSRKHIEKNFA